ncbi:WD repeat-containing protein 6 [Lunasporangiospora selenospora]|uniref:WD repeat-containing protein 6 n=1 Tax=Lunasporangiospora selenospora TaxID=979761 RepID=A0A9P6FS38_9FUNG|nr:WD repeat-containing protein 6 [Lunasporangiospora selenospora]
MVAVSTPADMSIPHNSAAGSSKQTRFASGSVSESGSESESEVKEIIDQKDAYYESIYFDTDDDSDADGTEATPKGKEAEDQDEDEKEYDRRAGFESKKTATSQTMAQAEISAITTGLQQSSLDASSSKKSGRKQRHKMISDAELLYDPDEDDRDEDWLIKKIAENCRTIETEVLRFPSTQKKPSKKLSDSNTESSRDVTEGNHDSEGKGAYQDLKLNEDDRNSAFHPVACEVCNTKIAVVDEDETDQGRDLFMSGKTARRIDHVHLTTPVTALAYHNNEILISGQGPYLKAMLISTSETLQCIHLGNDWKVHRIVLANVQEISPTIEARLFLVFGAKSLQILRLVVEKLDTHEHPKAFFQHLWNLPHMEDWIIDAQWLWTKENLPSENPCVRPSIKPGATAPPSYIALGYAHNFIQVFELPRSPFDIPLDRLSILPSRNHLSIFCLIYSVQSVEHCTLFCGRFHNNTLEDLLFASGTVFCHALLWKVHHPDAIEAPIEKSLIGHEGILFGIRWSQDGKAVCTVSDDRTIRIWDVSHHENVTHSTHYGHTARVWDCQIIGNYLISISEDATCRVWRNPLLTNLQEVDDMSDCLACWEGHEGKSAWSVAVSENGVVATGGGDGGIHLWRLDSVAEGSSDIENSTKDIDLPTITTYYPSAAPNEKEFIRDFVITSMDQSINATNTGFILVRNDKTDAWSTLYQSDLLKNYTSLESSPCGRTVIAGSLGGKVIAMSACGEFEPIIGDTLGGIKIQFVFVCNGVGQDDFRIIVFRANCTIGLFRLDIHSTESKKPAEFRHVCDLKLPNNNKAIHTAYFSPDYNLVLLGSRDGTVHVYDLALLEKETPEERPLLEGIIELKKCHGTDSVSSILMVTEQGEGYGGKDRINVYTTGRDGSWTRYRFLGLPGGEVAGVGADDADSDSESDDETTVGNDAVGSSSQNERESGGSGIVLQKIFQSKITKGWLEQVLIMDGELLFLGFFNKKLFVYNETKHFEIFAMHCGAANRRRWRFLTNNSRLEQARVMYHSGYKIRRFARELTAGHEIFQSAKLQYNFHGREVRHVRSLTHAQSLTVDAPAPIIFASGGEDCRLRLFQYIPYKTKSSCTALRPLCNLKPHLGGAIRCLEWSYTNEPHSYLLFTGGAVESMRAWQVTLSIPNSYQAQSLKNHQDKLILEHTPLSLGALELAQCPHASENLETRIMDLAVFRINHGLDPKYSGKHFIAAVYSDAAIRIWCFDEETHQFVLAIEHAYHGKCILQVSHLQLAKDGGHLVFTAATDGKIAIWDVSQALDRFLESYSTEMSTGGESSSHPHVQNTGRHRRSLQRNHVQSLIGTMPIEVVVHMSGVNSLFVQGVDQETILTVSGGDDNALVAVQIKARWDSEEREVVIESLEEIARVVDAHGSAIQAVAMTNASTIVTTSQDQQISLWKLDYPEDESPSSAKLLKLESQFIHVPDPSTMDVFPSPSEKKHSVAIAGIGIQVFDIHDNTTN